jgi:hypothetical protein
MKGEAQLSKHKKFHPKGTNRAAVVTLLSAVAPSVPKSQKQTHAEPFITGRSLSTGLLRAMFLGGNP